MKNVGSKSCQDSKIWSQVVICVLNWYSWRDTLDCLESLQQLSYPNFLTIVVDNGSMDDSVKKIKTWAEVNLEGGTFVEYTRGEALNGGVNCSEDALECLPSTKRLVLIRNELNLGFAGGNNVAIHYALHRRHPADYIFLLNNDAKVENDCLINLIHVAREADASIVGTVMKDESTGGIIQIAGRPNLRFALIRQFFQPVFRWPARPALFESDYWTCLWVSGSAMLIREDVLRDVYARRQQYFDNGLFLYNEEVEFCYFARQSGFKSVTTKLAAIYHKQKASSGGEKNPLAYYYINRNHIILAKRVLPLPWKILFPLINVPLCLLRSVKNAIYLRPRSSRAVLCALLDGYRGVTGKWRHHNR